MNEATNEATHSRPSTQLDHLSLSSLRRIRRGPPAANDDRCVDPTPTDAIDAWARHASATNGFADASSSPVPSVDLQRRASAARVRAMGALLAASLAPLWSAVRRMHARYRNYRAARETYRALRGLDDRTLHDLGFDRSEIESVAFEIGARA